MHDPALVRLGCQIMMAYLETHPEREAIDPVSLAAVDACFGPEFMEQAGVVKKRRSRIHQDTRS